MEPVLKYSLFVNVQPHSGSTNGYVIINGDQTVSEIPEHDFFIQVPISKTYKIVDYVDVSIDEGIDDIERQEINPFYYEYGFFDQMQNVHINKGDDLTFSIIEYIKSIRPELSNFSTDEIKKWFDKVGKNSLPWDTSIGKITIDDLDKFQTNLSNITSKADHLDIIINK